MKWEGLPNYMKVETNSVKLPLTLKNNKAIHFLKRWSTPRAMYMPIKFISALSILRIFTFPSAAFLLLFLRPLLFFMATFRRYTIGRARNSFSFFSSLARESLFSLIVKYVAKLDHSCKLLSPSPDEKI